MSKTTYIPLTISMGETLKAEVRELAWKRRIHVSVLIRQLIIAELEKEARKETVTA